MKKQQYILGLKDGYNLKKEQVLNIVCGAIACAGLPPSAINNMGKVETGKFDTATPAELKQTKAGCLVIRATEYEAEIIAKNNPDIFVESDVIHERY